MNDLADRIAGHYERHARAWDADRNDARRLPWNDRPWHERFVAALPHRGASVLDLGCGSGAPVATFMAASFLRVTGVDSSPTFISLCRERLPDHEWLVADMRGLRLPRRFDGILAWDSFFHLTPDDQRRMFQVFAQHAAASAVLMFNTGPAHGEEIGAYRGDPLYHASLDQQEYTSLLNAIGFSVLAHVTQDWQTGGGRTVWLAQARAEIPLGDPPDP
jgi:trans-aconitate methyltransferase